MPAQAHEVFPGIVQDPAILGGVPVIKGTRIQAALVAELMRTGATLEDMAEGYHLTPTQVQTALDFIAQQTARVP